MEFDQIFPDVFGRKAQSYKRIVQRVARDRPTPKDLAEALGVPINSDFSDHLKDLEMAGFVGRDFTFDTNGRKTSISRYRIKDNYLRFYLKYLEPRKDKIQLGLFQGTSLDKLAEWSSIVGLQFENLVLQNRKRLIELLKLPLASVETASPYFQMRTKKHAACQVDLLILTRQRTLYLCEIKFQKLLSIEVIEQVREKIRKLKVPKYFSVRLILVYAGERSPALAESEFFDQQIDFGSFLYPARITQPLR